MKHQYFADRRDFIKHELLLDLAERHPSPGRLLSILMLTPNDNTAEGGVKAYEQGSRRRELFEFLRGCLTAGTRHVSLLRGFMRKVGVDYRPYLDDDYFKNADRTEYFAMAATLARDHSLVLFDPDIGLETGTLSYMRRKGVERYLMKADVSVVARAALPDAVFVVYQHLQNDKRRVRADIDVRCRGLCHAVGSPSASFVTDHDVAFLVTGCGVRAAKWASQAVMSHGSKHGLEFGEVAV